MLPVIALVGRPNVGKSTLFNQLTRSRDALVADYSGLTRDRKYGEGQHNDRRFMVIDTGGITGNEAGIDAEMAAQSMVAIDEADVVLLMVDGRAGLQVGDQALVSYLRSRGKPYELVVNKIDGVGEEVAASDFHSLGVSKIHTIAASHNRGVRAMIEEVLEPIAWEADADLALTDGIRVAVVGRPNVGKSTLVNRLLGEDRVVVLLMDAREGVVEQDLHLLGQCIEAGRGLVVAINKWDGMDADIRERVKVELHRRLQFIDYADVHFISALHGTGVGHLYESIHGAYEAATRKLSTPKLTKLLEDIVATHPPPLVSGRRVKLRYAHIGGHNPPRIVIHGNQTENLPNSYVRYLENAFRRELDLAGTPIKIELRTGENPYAGRRNKLTERQSQRRRRMISHIKKADKKRRQKKTR